MSAKIFGRSKLFAQSDEERLKQLKAALLAKDSDAIWCARGGYGSLRLLPELAKLKRPKKFKWLLGYSDITTLHLFLNSKWGWPTLHSPNLDRFGRGAALMQEVIELNSILFNQEVYLAHKLTPLNAAAKKKTTLKGSIVGGNMACLQASFGTPWGMAPQKRILFFEDISERPHRMDRMFTQMGQAGLFNKAQAVVFGDMTGLSNMDERLLWNDVIARFAASQKIPVLRGVRAGHGKLQRTIPFLTDATLHLGTAAKLEMTLKPVRA
jgi:muramoyltetrapeptide carboxypeptidase